MLALLVSLTITAGNTPSLALPTFNTVGLESGSSELYAELLSQELGKHGVKVMTARDISTVLGIERQRQLAGCEDQSGCLIELSGALGIQGVLIADLGKLGSSYAFNAKVVSAKDGSTLAIFNTQVQHIEDVPNALARGAWSLTETLQAKHRWVGLTVGPPVAETTHAPTVSTEAPAPTNSKLALGITAAAVGAVGLGVGIAFQVLAGERYTALQTAPSFVAAQDARAAGRTYEMVSAVGFAFAGVGAASSVLFFLLGAKSPSVTPTVSLTPHGAAITFSGVLP